MADTNTIFWKRHDTAPAVQVQLTDVNGVPVNVTGATVKFIMCAQGSGTPKVTATATIVNGANGIVSYQPISADTDTPGTYEAEWEVTFSGGTKQTFPDPGYNAVTITADLDNA